MLRGKCDYRLIDHTADVGLLVRAPDAAGLFERAASALFDVMYDLDTFGGGGGAETVTASAPDREALLVAWLEELLSRSMAEETVYGEFHVTELSETSLEAEVRGEPLDLDRHDFRTEVKAVTYHHLLVSEDSDGWSARVIVDAEIDGVRTRGHVIVRGGQIVETNLRPLNRVFP